MSKYKLFECHNQEGITRNGQHISLRLAVAELNSLEYRNAEIKARWEKLKDWIYSIDASAISMLIVQDKITELEGGQG